MLELTFVCYVCRWTKLSSTHTLGSEHQTTPRSRSLREKSGNMDPTVGQKTSEGSGTKHELNFLSLVHLPLLGQELNVLQFLTGITSGWMTSPSIVAPLKETQS